MKFQIVFGRHSSGVLAGEVISPPPIGPLILASYLKKTCNIDLEVFDLNATKNDTEVMSQLNADVVGFSTWFSNYDHTVELVKKVKKQNPSSTILIGGPHASGLRKRILHNQEDVDYVFVGDAEQGLEALLNGINQTHTPGLLYRSNSQVKANPPSQGIDLSELPLFTLDPLKTAYQFSDNANFHEAFPVSGLRGCARKVRCKYCAIPTTGVRTQNANHFWDQLQFLHNQYRIDYFFETGDIFTPNHARALAKAKPQEFNPRLRCYSYPGMITKQNVGTLSKINVKNVFIGVESALIWDKQRKDPRRYANRYTPDSLHEEIELLARYGIEVTPSFILGLPGETSNTLRQNEEFIRDILDHPTVKQAVINLPMIFPGSEYFSACVNNQRIKAQYFCQTRNDLESIDQVDYPLLTRLFVEEYTTLKYQDVFRTAHNITANGVDIARFS